MPSTYTPIATQTLGSAASDITFSSISASYTDLILIVSGTVSTSFDNIALRFNGDSGSNYSWTYLLGNGSSAASGRASNVTNALSGGFGNSQIGNVIFQINNYSNTTTNKTVISRSNKTDDAAGAWVSLWRNTAAINSIILRASGGANLSSGLTATLYGVKSA